mgnify:CR=1 FL=1
MRVLICSGRFYADTHTITHVLDLYARTQTINVLIHGGHQALGGAIENWARGIDVHVIRYPANNSRELADVDEKSQLCYNQERLS